MCICEECNDGILLPQLGYAVTWLILEPAASGIHV
jgi:hypothetical protein